MHVFTPDRIAARRIGVFWFIAKDRNPARFAGVSRPWSSVPTIAGKKVLDQDHADVWPIVQKLGHKLQPYPDDYFPRGRLTWLEDGDRWQLFVDQKLKRGCTVVTAENYSSVGRLVSDVAKLLLEAWVRANFDRVEFVMLSPRRGPRPISSRVKS
jgi:hypothetical protein